MLQAYWGFKTDVHAGLMEKIWAFRHQQFVERLGWEEIRRADSREIDEFDSEGAIHLPLLHGDEIVGYTRLLPTTEPHLLSDVYPELMDGREWPRAANIYEWTRCISAKSAGPMQGVAASNLLMTAVVEFCLCAGIASLIVETHPKLVSLLISTGWTVMPLAAPTLFRGSLLVPIEARPSAKTLMTHHQVYGINGSLLHLSGGERHPFAPEQAIERLPYMLDDHKDCTLEHRRLARVS
ncbi:acyl-homoserine-lactone synthase [Rhizobium leguminosarum]|uniref:acyl-homoserine-lactone synthase n=1 Tax=Rhizobium leguminosarum TaxID=384 RepID=UPI001D7E1857|nr:acyl-homoserine-lactone synthase [Rhizobium leguminosarum]MBP2444078.1 acyl-homoserine lactone synthase [Rhizobium leguminosarum]